MARFQEKFGCILRKRREQADLSQEALAEKAGLHRTYISLGERGLRTPTILVVKRLADGIGTAMTSLIGELEQSDQGSNLTTTGLVLVPGHGVLILTQNRYCGWIIVLSLTRSER